MPNHRTSERHIPAVEKSGVEPETSTLLPMLVAGLVLIVLGAIIVMMFV